MQRDNQIFMAFSASHCETDRYKLGLLTLRDGADPMAAGSWLTIGPVLKSANGNMGTGHNEYVGLHSLT